MNLQYITLARSFAASELANAGGSVPLLVIQDVLVGGGDSSAAAGDAIGVRQAGWRQPVVLRPCTDSPLGEQVESSGDESHPLKVMLVTADWESQLKGRMGGKPTPE